MFYTGIGSRNTPEADIEKMKFISGILSAKGLTLRSGGADGADTAFEVMSSKKEIYLPWNGFNNRRINSIYDRVYIDATKLDNYSDAVSIAYSLHPAYDRLKQGARKLHTRNVYQVLGFDLKSKSDFVILWAEPCEDGVCGGTNTAYKLAKLHGVKTYNLYYENEYQELLRVINDI